TGYIGDCGFGSYQGPLVRYLSRRYSFNVADLSGVYLANRAQYDLYGNPAYDASMVSGAIINTVNPKYGTAALRLTTQLTSSAYQVVNLSPFTPKQNGYTISFWIKSLTPYIAGNSGIAFSWSNGFSSTFDETSMYLTRTNSTINIQCNMSDTSLNSCSLNVSSSYKYYSWNQIAWTFNYDPSGGYSVWKIYFNGALVLSSVPTGASVAMPGYPTSATKPYFTIGGRTFNGLTYSKPLGAMIDEFLIYETVLSASEINYNYLIDENLSVGVTGPTNDNGYTGTTGPVGVGFYNQVPPDGLSRFYTYNSSDYAGSPLINGTAIANNAFSPPIYDASLNRGAIASSPVSVSMARFVDAAFYSIMDVSANNWNGVSLSNFSIDTSGFTVGSWFRPYSAATLYPINIFYASNSATLASYSTTSTT
ncbi:LamG domain-containing protein, partial [bacterium]|nr:LamG domain-containing protein [bacterium]